MKSFICKYIMENYLEINKTHKQSEKLIRKKKSPQISLQDKVHTDLIMDLTSDSSTNPSATKH